MAANALKFALNGPRGAWDIVLPHRSAGTSIFGENHDFNRRKSRRRSGGDQKRGAAKSIQRGNAPELLLLPQGTSGNPCAVPRLLSSNVSGNESVRAGQAKMHRNPQKGSGNGRH